MSNPKEKAEELVAQYKIILMDEDTDCGEEILCTLIAQKSALICVDEIINNNVDILNGTDYDSELNYWQDVIEEINKL